MFGFGAKLAHCGIRDDVLALSLPNSQLQKTMLGNCHRIKLRGTLAIYPGKIPGGPLNHNAVHMHDQKNALKGVVLFSFRRVTRMAR